MRCARTYTKLKHELGLEGTTLYKPSESSRRKSALRQAAIARDNNKLFTKC